jgi:biotin carboxyl carrier protein
MKLQAAIGDSIHDIEMTRDGDQLRVCIDDRKYDLEASEPEPSVYLLKHDNNVYEASVSPTDASNFIVSLRGHDVQVKITDPKRLRGSGGDHHTQDGAAEIKTAMPGKVVRILVSTGDTVTKGDGVIVVEAMKMQNEMKSPKDGRVTEIKIAEGDTVGAGDVLLVIE